MRRCITLETCPSGAGKVSSRTTRLTRGGLVAVRSLLCRFGDSTCRSLPPWQPTVGLRHPPLCTSEQFWSRSLSPCQTPEGCVPYPLESFVGLSPLVCRAQYLCIAAPLGHHCCVPVVTLAAPLSHATACYPSDIPYTSSRNPTQVHTNPSPPPSTSPLRPTVPKKSPINLPLPLP